MAARVDAASPLLRRGLLGLAALTTLGIAVELYTEHHWTQRSQLIAWAALALVALGIALLLGYPSPRRVRAAQIVAVDRGGKRGGGGVAAHPRELRRRPAGSSLRADMGEHVRAIALVAGGAEGGGAIAAARPRRAGGGGVLRPLGDATPPGTTHRARRPAGGARRMTGEQHRDRATGTACLLTDFSFGPSPPLIRMSDDGDVPGTARHTAIQSSGIDGSPGHIC